MQFAKQSSSNIYIYTYKFKIQFPSAKRIISQLTRIVQYADADFQAAACEWLDESRESFRFYFAF